MFYQVLADCNTIRACKSKCTARMLVNGRKDHSTPLVFTCLCRRGKLVNFYVINIFAGKSVSAFIREIKLSRVARLHDSSHKRHRKCVKHFRMSHISGGRPGGCD